MGGEAEAAPLRFEQPQTEIARKLGDTPANGAMRQCEFCGGGAHRPYTGHDLEGAQVVEGG